MDAARIPTFRLLVGLGNPGREYAGTRHNAGFMLLDRLAARAGVGFQVSREWQAEVAVHNGVRLCKPLSFMNLSGEPVGALSRYYRISPAETLVIYDDVALPLGRLRLRRAGSAGGHNGVRSLIEHLGTADFPRLRMGIGAADSSSPMTGHVLGRFRAEEKAAWEKALDRGVAAIEHAQNAGFESAMNLFNQTEPTNS